MQLSEEQVLALAPDESSKKSGKELSNPAKWVSKGVNEVALWGECQGSGSKPYQTQVDTVNIAFKCSCPSRKFPCKHGVGLLLLYARSKSDFTSSDMPAWVADWINKRSERQEKQATQKEKPVDEAAQAKRRQAREQKVGDGIEELLQWIKDIIRNGIIGMPEKGSGWFEGMARRMVDAQAPGLANMIKGLGEINFYRDGWQTEFIDQLLRLYLVITGYKNSESLPALLQQDLRTWIGFTQNQDELKEQPGLTDTWLVLGKQVTEEDNITVERNWLYGTTSDQYALVLQFLVRGQGGQLALTPGLFVQAELVFYPSVVPLRAIVKQQLNTEKIQPCKGFSNWQQVVEAETDYSSALPFRNERPFIIEQVRPVFYSQQWWLQDANNAMMSIKSEFKSIWKLLSLSGGDALNMAVVGKEKAYEPFGVWYQNEYTIL
ncbi:SWIM zinc finger family protein [Niastella caeni]|uniref:SWIM zinc finger family protein n=1 Tax=Niastella caeni TaxID=2569763 RepID=A0A4S8HSY9_9BACT|nr:SWIM zinc finger family protein [Niastella caeni]THU37094.1 SWIM zinc finger family protein [Niastella caeni]